MVKNRVEKLFSFSFLVPFFLLVDESGYFLISGLSVLNYISNQVVHLLM